MSKHLPPIPPANVSNKGPGGDKTEDITGSGESAQGAGKNLAQQGQQGNTKQNTTNQGFQQDR